jgi:hypothetical protein
MTATYLLKELAGGNRIRVTYMCVLCGQPASVVVDQMKFNAWYQNPVAPMIQEAFPELTDDERETLISGSHGECFDKAFPEEDDEEGWPGSFPTDDW